MSKVGRFEDALYDVLYGYDNGDGSFTAGPLQWMKPDQLSKLIDNISGMAVSILMVEPGREEGSSRSQSLPAEPA